MTEVGIYNYLLLSDYYLFIFCPIFLTYFVIFGLVSFAYH